MKNILVAYATMSGTTADVARTISEEFKKLNFQVTVMPLSDLGSIKEYDAFVIGAPMIVGWHREAKKFLQANRQEFTNKPVALFATAMNLTQTGETSFAQVPLFIDQELAVLPKVTGKLSFKERYATIPNYIRPMLQAAGKSKPVSIALFGGRLDIYRLKWWAAIFVMLVIRAKPGEKRNWEAIRAWSNQIASDMAK
jgi:menaquinone-dependent protoporphyrinogen oxidase